MNYIKKLPFKSVLSILFFIFLYGPSFGQERNEEIDYFIEKAEEENYRYNFSKSIDYALKAYQFSLSKSYKLGIIESQYELAYAHYSIGKFSDGLEFLNNISKNYLTELKENENLYLKYTELKGKLLLWMGFTDKSNDEFRKFLKLSSFIKDDQSRYLNQLKGYSLLGINPENDSSKYYLNQALSYQDRIKDKHEFVLAYINLGRYYLKKQNKTDSAAFYNKIANQIAQNSNSRYLFLIKLQEAEIENRKGNFDSAISKSFVALKMARDQKRGLETMDAYRLIADTYGEQKNYQKEIEYLRIYSHVNDSIYADIHSNLFSVIVQLETDILKQNQQNKKRTYLFFVCLVALILCLAYLFYRLINYKKGTKLKTTIIQNKDIEVKNLLTKLQNDKEEDLLYVAQNNPIEFPARFAEIHSHFIDKLLQIEPNLVSTEITFCAYLRLQFSTKDIASIMYVTPKAIQNRKNRIRKKLNIPSNEDIYVWFSKL